MLRHNRDDLCMLLIIVRTDGLIQGGAADFMDDKVTDRLHVVLRHDANTLFDRLAEDEVIKNDAIKIRTEKAENHGLRVVRERAGKRHQDPGDRHGLTELNVKEFIHDLRDDVEPAGGSIVIKEDAEANGDNDTVAQHIEGRVPGQGAVMWEHPLKDAEKNRQQEGGIHRFKAEFSTEDREANDKQHHIHDHRELRYRKRQKIRQHDGEARNARNGRMARHQKEKDRKGHDKAGNGHKKEILY